MSDPNPEASAPTEPRPGLGRGLKLAVVAAVLIGLAGVLYVSFGASGKPGGADRVQALATGTLAKLQVPKTPVAAPGVSFNGPDGAPARLTDFRGKVVVLNLWATWCAPCVKEMPTLAALQTAYAGKPVQVLAVSQDRTDKTADARAFIAKHAPLAFYQDAAFALMPALDLPAPGFPTTVIYDKQGLQRAYLQGEADWSSPEARAVIDKLLGE